ncbi:uncharacterized protein METZ01_LOCUS162485 [marine metagenome]|uniref:Uncharacterized protein n=1 Tax=marine metagenome TaxID=408172 RepID=A0A382B7Z3_9ZZZZ
MPNLFRKKKEGRGRIAKDSIGLIGFPFFEEYYLDEKKIPLMSYVSIETHTHRQLTFLWESINYVYVNSTLQPNKTGVYVF